MFRIWRKWTRFPVAKSRAARRKRGRFDHLPFIDNETLDQFLASPDNIERLPVDPTEYRPEFQRLIVSAYIHEASRRAKRIEMA